MATLTVRLSDDTHTRLKELARHRRISVNKLMEELSTIAITQHDAETRFRALAARGVRRACVFSIHSTTRSARPADSPDRTSVASDFNRPSRVRCRHPSP